MTCQADFAAALFDPARPCPSGLRAWNGSDPALRYAVHRNNVVVSLIDALADTFPVVRELVGGDFFAAMAREFVQTHPPRSPVLALYGDALPEFIERFAPADGVPYLADIARLEHARVRACHAADAPALGAQAVAARLARPEALPAARLTLHPSVSAVASRHAVVSLWAAHQGAVHDIARVDPTQPEAALVLREGEDAVVVAIEPATAQWLHRIASGATLAEAAHAAPQLDLAAAFGVLLRHPALTAWEEP
jgi:hypothetical protein